MGRGRPKKDLSCGNCGTVFASRQSLYSHKKKKICAPKHVRDAFKTGNTTKKIPCKYCEQKFTRVNCLNRHIKRVHSGKHFRIMLCGLCPQSFKTRSALKMHRLLMHSPMRGGLVDGFVRTASAHRKACEVYRLAAPEGTRQPDAAVYFAKPKILRLMRRLLVDKRNARISTAMNVRFRKVTDGLDDGDDDDDDGRGDGEEGVDVLTVPMTSSFHMMRYMSDEEEDQLDSMFSQIDHTLDAFVRNGSGWVVNNILGFDVQVMECHSLAGQCCTHEVKYVRGVKDPVIRHANEEVRMDGQRCFYRAVAAAILHMRQADEYLYREPEERELEEFIHANICENVPTPVNVADVAKFEAANQHLDIAVNVMYQDDITSEVYPVKPSRNLGAKYQVNLLLFYLQSVQDSGEKEKESLGDDGGEQEEQKTKEEKEAPPLMHYAWIKNLQDVMGVIKKTSRGQRYKRVTHLCFNCFLQFHSHEALVNHAAWCHLETGQRKQLPRQGETYEYSSTRHEIKFPWFFV